MTDESRRGFLKIGASMLGVGCLSSLTGACSTIVGERGAETLRAKRWAMVVDVRRCLQKDGCRACIDACHRGHNVPSFSDPRREVKWVWKESYEHAMAVEHTERTPESLREKSVLVLCNHCDNPPCVRVCPTGATWRREDGLVMMDEHRCIGCRYCVVGCPYGARSFNWSDPRPHIATANPEFPTRTRGVVEKCNFCVDRLLYGKQPLCVEACKATGPAALAFGDLGDSGSSVAETLRSRYSMRRKSHLGTSPHVFYII